MAATLDESMRTQAEQRRAIEELAPLPPPQRPYAAAASTARSSTPAPPDHPLGHVFLDDSDDDDADIVAATAAILAPARIITPNTSLNGAGTDADALELGLRPRNALSSCEMPM